MDPEFVGLEHCSTSAVESGGGMKVKRVYFKVGQKLHISPVFEVAFELCNSASSKNSSCCSQQWAVRRKSASVLIRNCFLIGVRESIHLPQHDGAHIEQESHYYCDQKATEVTRCYHCVAKQSEPFVRRNEKARSKFVLAKDPSDVFGSSQTVRCVGGVLIGQKSWYSQSKSFFGTPRLNLFCDEIPADQKKCLVHSIRTEGWLLCHH